MGFLDKAKCKVGRHMGAWSPPSTDDCSTLRACERCGKESVKTAHYYVAQFEYETAQDCTMVRSCKRCGALEHRVEHIWGRSVYVAPGRCNQESTCTRCATVRRSSVPVHELTTWEYDSPDACNQVVRCQRCGVRGLECRLMHQWSGFVFSEAKGRTVRHCTRCGAMDA